MLRQWSRVRWHRAAALCSPLRGGASAAPRPSESDPDRTPSSSTTTTSSALDSSDASSAARLSRAVLERDFQSAQRVLEQSWRDEYVIPVFCLGAVLLVYYSSSSSHRATVRRSEAAESKVREELHQLREQLVSLTEKWEREMVQRDQQIMDVQQQNMDLARVVDQMTVALKQCPPKIL